MKIPALDSFRVFCLLAFLVPWTAWSQTPPDATVQLLAEAPSKNAEPKKLGETLKLNPSGSTFVWALITLNGAKRSQGPNFAVEWQIKTGNNWQPLRPERPQKTVDIATSPVSQNSTSPRRVISQELKSSDKGTLRLRVVAKDGKEMGTAQVTLTN